MSFSPEVDICLLEEYVDTQPEEFLEQHGEHQTKGQLLLNIQVDKTSPEPGDDSEKDCNF